MIWACGRIARACSLGGNGGILRVIFNDIVRAVAVLAVGQRKDEGCKCHGDNDGGKNHRLRQWIRNLGAVRLRLAAVDRRGTGRAAGLQQEEVGSIAQ